MSYNSAYLSEQYVGAGRHIHYYTTTDVHTDVDAASYFDDGVSHHKMAPGDPVLVSVVDSVTAPTSVTSFTLHHVASVSGNAATVGAASAGSTITAIKTNATASPAAGDDVLDGYAVGSVWVDVTNDEAYIAASVATAGAIWLNIANDVVFGPVTYTVVTAGAVITRLVAPFAGRVSATRAVLNGVITGTDKLIRTVVSGNTIGSGSLTITNGSAAGTVFAATPTTDNAIAAGNVITLQSGAQVVSGSTVNLFVVCRRQNTA